MAASYLLPRVVGLSKATELLFTGDFISAAEAERIGLYNRVVPAGELSNATRDFAERLARGPAFALGKTKEMLNRELRHESANGTGKRSSGTSDLHAASGLPRSVRSVCCEARSKVSVVDLCTLRTLFSTNKVQSTKYKVQKQWITNLRTPLLYSRTSQPRAKCRALCRTGNRTTRC